MLDPKLLIVNALTLSRFPGSLVMVHLYLTGVDQWYILVLAALLGFTDALDGYLARCWNRETTFGKVVDPFMDKALIWSLMFIAVHNNLALYVIGWPYVVIPLALLGVLIVYDATVIGLRIIFWIREWLEGRKYEMPSHYLAKLKTVLVIVGLIVAYADLEYDTISWLSKLFGIGLVSGAAILALKIGWDYYERYVRSRIPRLGKTKPV